jgi:hypothetical protein
LDSSYRLRLAKAKLAAGQDAATAQDALIAVASAPSASYDLRLKSATALAGRAHSDLGSAELNLLAGDPAAITPAAADKFYFYAVRLKAAQKAPDTPAKLRLLSHCTIDFPRRDEARVPLFQAAAAANANEYAVGVMEPLFQAQFLRSPAAVTGNDNEEEQIASSEEEDSANDADAPASAAMKLSRAQQAEVAQMLGDTMSRLNRLDDAVAYYESARRVESSPAIRQVLLRKIAEAKATLRIQHQNAARQPLLHEPLEQDRVVRPQLARSNPAPRGAAVQAGVKPGGVTP